MKDDERIVQLRDNGKSTPGEDPIPEINIVTALEHAEIAREAGFGDCDPVTKLKTTSDWIHCSAVKLGRTVETMQATHGCLLSGPGRGDCWHALGLPGKREHPETIDHYGRPNGWCQVCWQSERIAVLEKEYKKLIKDYDQSEKENKAYNSVFARLRGQLANGARELADWCDNQKAKELGK